MAKYQLIPHDQPPTVDAFPLAGDLTISGPAGSTSGAAGDYLVVDAADDVTIEPKAAFEAAYQLVPDGKSPAVLVDAVAPTSDFAPDAVIAAPFPVSGRHPVTGEPIA